MSENPYAGGHDPQFDYYEEPQRTSILAILSLCSLLCCLPGIGILGMFLAAVSLVFIGGSHGRLAGKGMAAIGLIVGLMVTVIQGAIFFGALQAWQYYTQQMAPAATTLIVAVDAGDLATAQSILTAGEDLTTEELERFSTILEQHIGAVQGTSVQIGDVWAAFGQTFSNRSSGSSINVQSTGNSQPIPIVVLGDHDSLLVWALFDTATLNSPDLKLLDILVILPGTTDAFSLRSSDEAKEISIRLGAQLLHADEMPIPPSAAPLDAPAPVDAEESPDTAPVEPPSEDATSEQS